MSGIIIKTEKDGAILCVQPSGRLDSVTSLEFEKELLGLIAKGETQLLLDFSALNYISSAGLRVVLMAAKRIKASKGKMALCSLSDNIKQVFKVSGFATILNIQDSKAQAISQIR